jgi:hypothetical protein
MEGTPNHNYGIRGLPQKVIRAHQRFLIELRQFHTPSGATIL